MLTSVSHRCAKLTFLLVRQSNMWMAAGSGIASMYALVSFASALNNADADGRVVIDVAGGTLKFLLLNAAAHFAKVRCTSPYTIDLGIL